MKLPMWHKCLSPEHGERERERQTDRQTDKERQRERRICQLPCQPFGHASLFILLRVRAKLGLLGQPHGSIKVSQT